MDRVVPRHEHEESGFTLIEVMISAVILVTGLLSLAYAFGLGLATINTAQMDSIARQKARQAMEDVFTARDTQALTFSQICNIGTGSACIFINGFEPLYTAGNTYGIVNTFDDGIAVPLPGVVTNGTANSGAVLPQGCSASPCIESVDTPGPDGILGTADDVWVPLTGYQRQIAITVITPALLNQITVTIKYTTPQGITRSVTLVALIGPYV